MPEIQVKEAKLPLERLQELIPDLKKNMPVAILADKGCVALHLPAQKVPVQDAPLPGLGDQTFVSAGACLCIRQENGVITIYLLPNATQNTDEFCYLDNTLVRVVLPDAALNKDNGASRHEAADPNNLGPTFEFEVTGGGSYTGKRCVRIEHPQGWGVDMDFFSNRYEPERDGKIPLSAVAHHQSGRDHCDLYTDWVGNGVETKAVYDSDVSREEDGGVCGA